jgi:hypothetical protein
MILFARRVREFLRIGKSRSNTKMKGREWDMKQRTCISENKCFVNRLMQMKHDTPFTSYHTHIIFTMTMIWEDQESVCGLYLLLSISNL